jgi:hypothetical protein
MRLALKVRQRVALFYGVLLRQTSRCDFFVRAQKTNDRLLPMDRFLRAFSARRFFYAVPRAAP